MERDSFIFYRSFAAIGDIPDIDMRDRLIWALIRYAIDGVEPQLNGIEAVLFAAYRPQVDANNKRYENGCKGAEYGKLGAEYGKRGGRPKKKKALQCNDDVTNDAEQITPQKYPENPRNVNVNVNENANDNDTTVVVNAREAFCKAYGVTVDDTTTNGIDFAVLSKSYSESAKFLQKHQVARRMSWVVKHYDEIIAGKYTDFAEHKAPPPTAQAQNSFTVEDD